MEYVVVTANGTEEIRLACREMASQGFELVTATNSGDWHRLFFRRPKAESPIQRVSVQGDVEDNCPF